LKLPTDHYQIEVVMDASNVPEVPPPKSLSERVAYAESRKSKLHPPLTNISANPRAQPKSATVTKATTNGAAKAGRAARAIKSKKGRKPKTAEELDAEMTDYWGTNTNGAPAAAATDGMATGGTGAAANGEDLGMDEISVGSIEIIT
jgi:THO complex subunit 4